ncbi:type IV secretory system conjugative DNA transfer family protein [Acinetobacter soli]|uniref:type IV secretory system conjugative DNA transfer family protein n=1 Tax=Acinetobacter soli TaxID=487316 RepID=UPI00124FF0C9|nr:type IV secretory system conjugative DNA transfer family protein [Acinetobacter soli]
MTFKILLILLLFVGIGLFAAAYFVTNFIISEMIGKVKQDHLEDVKRTAAKYSLIPLIILFAGFSYFLRVKFTLQNSEFFIIYGISAILFFLAFFFGAQFIDPKNIEYERKTIEKKQSAEGLGTLLNEVELTEDVGTPLISYILDDQLKEPVWKALRVTNEDRGIVAGVPGAGKTAYLVLQLIDWMESGQSFVATDIKPEIWAILKYNNIFEQFGYKDWVFNPTDINADHYNLFSEVHDSAEFNEVLNIIISDTDSVDAKFFNDNARRLLKAVLIELGPKASLPNAQRFINSMNDNAELLKTLRQSDNETVSIIAKDITRTAKSENLLASIMTAASKAFDFLDDERIRKSISDNAEGFYLKDVLMQPKQAVFLQFDQQYKSSTATLFGATVAHIMRILQANQERGAVFLALDEIINCAPIPKFTDLLNTIRSANMPTFLYLQSLEGLNRLYGTNAERLFLGSSNYKVMFRIEDNFTAEEFSKLIGKTETTYYSYAKNKGQGVNNHDIHTQSTSSGDSETTRREYIIEPDELIHLPKYTAVVMYNGTFGTLDIPKYWEFFDMPIRIKKASPSDYLNYEKTAI